MYADPGMVMPQSMVKEGMSPQQMMQDQMVDGQSVQNFNKLVANINPNQAMMDPAVLAMMKANNPDGSLASNVLKSVKWLRKNVDGSLDELKTSVETVKQTPKGEQNIAEILDLQLQAGTFTFVMSMTTNLVNKSTQHLDTLIKAQ